MDAIPNLENFLECYAKTPEGIPLWKTKGIVLTYENLLENVFILSTDIAEYFEIRRYDLINRNFYKLFSEKYIKHERKIAFMFDIANSAQRSQIIYAFTTSETEFLIMDFSGPKARQKKLEILKRLQAIEADVLKGAFEQARQKASTWDGVELLNDLGFIPSLPNQLATKKDIATFLDIPEATLSTFLSKHTDQIETKKLTVEEIRAAGKKANQLNAYKQEDVFKIAFWMDTEIGKKLKEKIFGDIGIYATPTIKGETEWKITLSKIFATLGFKYQHPIGQYTVDFFVADLSLVLECDALNHKYYDQKQEQERDDYITQYHTLIRFNSQISLETLINRILRMQPKELIKLYIPPEEKRVSK